ncbi:enoyl-CoA hydratase/isomerase family protein [Sagittula sp. NFXS13]|uniref:enoyl-CoA hydratase/isomerase family protein n=1 Tax=Sagittula sp. NFXS13 TaxID=2819095 RepID=UPI0032DE6129
MTSVRRKITDGIARLTLTRPDAANAIDFDLADALFDALDHAAGDDAVRCIVLGAEGKLFCGGGDISAFGQATDALPEQIGALARSLHRSIALIDQLDKPLVTSIQGTAAGAGLVLAALGDIALASDRARFHPAYLGIGLTPDGGTTWHLPRLVGARRATEMLLCGQTMDADEAAACGLITRVVPHDRLHEETQSVAARLAKAPGWALRRTKHLLAQGRSASLRDHLDAEATGIAEAASRPDAAAAIRTFLSRR